MKHPTATFPRLSVLALCLSSAGILPACSTGGGVQQSQTPPASQPPPPTPPPPPPPPPTGPRSLTLPVAAPPRTAPAVPAFNSPATDTVRVVPANEVEYIEHIRSAGALVKQGPGSLSFYTDMRFDGGTLIQEGTLSLFFTTLFSDVTVSRGATFQMSGDVVGSIVNNGFMAATEPSGWYEAFYDAEVFGDYTQGPEGVLRLLFGLQEMRTATPLLNVHGRATIDGMVDFLPTGFVTSNGYLEWIIHADGGLNGRFDGWNTIGSPFLAGELRYLENDAYFLASRVSTQAALAAAGVGSSLTHASAARVDEAFRVGDSIAAQPGAARSLVQRQFLHSAAAIQRLGTLEAAVDTFDSLAGHGHVSATRAVLRQAGDAGRLAGEHVSTLRAGARPGAWSAQSSPLSALPVPDASAGTSGYDHWLDDKVFLGARFSWTRQALSSERVGGIAHVQAPITSLTLGRLGDNGSYVLGDLGYGRHEASIDRFIDLGDVRRPVHVDRVMDVTHAYVETGRKFTFGRSQLTPFAGFGATTLRSAGFTERGDTGFELTAPGGVQRLISGDVGLRYATAWRWGSERWLQLALDGRYAHQFNALDPLLAAFTGAPEASFELSGLSSAREGAQLRANLLGGGQRWSWQLGYGWREGERALSFGLERVTR